MAGLLETDSGTLRAPRQRGGDEADATADAAPRPIQTPALAQVVEQVEAKLPEAVRERYLRIVVAGLKLLYSEQTRPSIEQALATMRERGHDPAVIATGITNLLVILYRSSRGQMAVEVVYPAGVTLMAYVLDDLARTQGLEVTPPLIKAIGRQLAQHVMQVFDVQPQVPTQASQPEPGAAAAGAPEPSPTGQGRE